METPLKLKWLGRETGEICQLIAPFHPLILISPTPRLRSPEIPPGLFALPHRVCKVWDLSGIGKTDPLMVSQTDCAERNGLTYEALELGDGRSFAAIYQFYFDVFLRNAALRNFKGVAAYRYLEELHRVLLESKFIVLIRARSGNEIVGGSLLRHPTAAELVDYRECLSPFASIERTNVAIIDLICADVRFEQGMLKRPLVQRTIQWAQEAGYSFLSSAPAASLAVGENEGDEVSYLPEGKAIPVYQKQNTALLYCDIGRCSYLTQDVYYYSCDERGTCLNYIVNVVPTSPLTARLLNSLIHIEKRVYTRHARVRAALSAAGIECESQDSVKSSRPGQPKAMETASAEVVDEYGMVNIKL